MLRADGDRQARILQAEGQAKAIRTVFDAIHQANPSQKVLAYQYLQALPQIANGTANKVWIMPTELTKALEGLGGALGGLANMVGDLPVGDGRRGRGRARGGGRGRSGGGRGAAGRRRGAGRPRRRSAATTARRRCPRRKPIPPSAALGGADYNGVADRERRLIAEACDGPAVDF